MATEDQDYRRRSPSYSHRDYSRFRDDRLDGDRYKRSGGDIYSDSRSADRYRHRRSRDYDYPSHSNRYDDRSSSRRKEDKYSRSSRYDGHRSRDRYNDRRTRDRSGSERYSSSRRGIGSRFSDDRTPLGAFRGRGIPRGRGGSHANVIKLYSIILENLDEECSSVDLMIYCLQKCGMPDFTDAFGEARESLDIMIAMNFKKSRVGGFSGFTIAREES
uniref:RRM domain-containing protein n=1 Tax=Strongyloides venezuelensis TaxID=75913 RepID=A0A0K0G3Y0_STRVS